ncbi:MAG: NADPH-dependent FMN reductase [Oligoflexales bacterium]
MHITIVSGSHREISQSIKVAKFCQKVLLQQNPSHSVSILSLAENPLPLWDEGVWDKTPEWKKLWGPMSHQLAQSDAIVVVAPEWSGMCPSGLKNLFLLCSNAELAHKPGLIVGISSTTGGAYPVSELRSHSGKNTRLVYIPDHVIIRYVEKVLVSELPASPEDEYIRSRIEYSLRVLVKYGEALRLIRDGDVIDLKKFPNGM